MGWTVGLLLTCLLLAVGWVAVRGIGAVDALQTVRERAGDLKTAIAARDVDEADRVAASIARHAASAHDLTSDPVWTAFGYVPWLGPNFRAVSEVASITDDVASDALSPVLDAATGLDLARLGFSGGAVDLTPFAAIEPSLADAADVLADAAERARRIDADATLPPLADAVREMRGAVTEAAGVVGGLHGAALLLPSMLGGEGPRSYVVAMQNNAELRSSGGIIGSIALIHAENGQISLVRQASTRDFPPLDAPLPLSESTVALFEDGPGRYLQNLTSIPDFAEAGPAIAARWQGVFGGTVDGVVTVDAVVAAHLLEASGDVSFGPFTVSSATVVDVLLSQIYAAVPDPAAQDEVFAQAASALLGTALTTAEPQALLAALATAADEHRIRIWSAHEDEQSVLAASSLSGTLPTDADGEATVGVLLNDTTGGKMDYYARAEVGVATGVCEGIPTTQVRVTWSNDAPQDAAASLPTYVTGGGQYGVDPGSVRTLIAVYGPEGSVFAGSQRDGAEEPVQTALLGTRPVVQHEVVLVPGESTTVVAEFRDGGSGERLTSVSQTPTVSPAEATRDELRCGS